MHKLIAHVLLEKDGRYLLIKRSKTKRGEPNFLAEYWDIPGGTVEYGELPRQAAVREVLEEVNQVVSLDDIIHEDSQYDEQKDSVFTRLVYKGHVNKWRDIALDFEEHSEYCFVTSLEELKSEKVVDYLVGIL